MLTWSSAGTVPPPNAAVTKAENALVADLSTKMSAVSLGEQLPMRPGYGKQGRPVVVWTNYFHMVLSKSAKDLYRYKVTVLPDTQTMSKLKKRRFIELVMEEPAFQGISAASDYAQMIITDRKVPLSDGPQNRKQFRIQWYPADGTPIEESDDTASQAARARNTNVVQVEQLDTVAPNELMAAMNSSSATGFYALRDEAIQALNIILTRGAHTDPHIVNIGQNKFYPVEGHALSERFDLGKGLEALRGYFSSVRTSVSRLLLNVNVSTSAFYRPGPLLELKEQFMAGGESMKTLQSFFRLLRVETNYIVAKDKNGKAKKDAKGQEVKVRKVKTIWGFEPNFKNANQVTFNVDGQGQTQITVKEYFRRTYGIVLRAPQEPVINVGNREKPTYIPMELCTVLPGQVARRMLGSDQTRAMIEFAARSPDKNATSITQNGLRVMRTQAEHNSALASFGIQVGNTLLTVDARILAAPMLLYGNKKTPASEGKWNLRAVKYSNPANVPKWGALIVDHGRPAYYNESDAPPVVNGFANALRIYGLTVPAPEATQKVFIQRGAQAAQMRQEFSKTFKNCRDRGIRILLVLLGSDNSTMYDMLKRVGDVEYGIATVCCIASKTVKERGLDQYFANVGLKWNLKCGGVNHHMDLNDLSPLDNKSIVFGIDVTHPSPGSSENAPSITGVVASVDKYYNQYPASIRSQRGKVEMVNASDLTEMVIERLKHWRSKNQNALPNKVIIYRDGVSEGQFKTVLAEEWPAFRAAYTALYGADSKHPKTSIIICTKRGHTRFYPTKEQDAEGKAKNVHPGTVVDRGVTGERLFDFYLVAHAGLQGTSKPAHYIVLKDENKLGADQLQKLTHNLCYAYGRATRAVSVCPPAYYADLVCERGRSYLHAFLKENFAGEYKKETEWSGGVHDDLRNSMFYL
ncbi:Piwi-domain-containing protein [Saccharata proteae CBS 121410]|uniref:Piwi-domain-containing protein n=1 Tax=Saccharata proteae CBS 121410 TaxID=1314787 RepID=A0A6A5YCA6_9PEZI|nr:Piwi-domain-containing protein [Saccharata proteae CBS 121410]